MALARIAMIGFAPDLDPLLVPQEQQEMPGHWLACDGFYPTLKGFRRTKSPAQIYPALSEGCRGAYVARYLDGSSRLLAGTATDLWYGTSTGTWESYGGSSSPFSLASDARWRFAQFGNDTIAVGGHTQEPQFLGQNGTEFAALAGIPPWAKYVAVASNFVFLLNLYSSDVGSLLTPTMWWCSGIGDDGDWTPSLATQCANGYLDDTPGEIVGAKALGRSLIVYKERAVHILNFVGPPVIWENQILSREAGALSNEAVVDIGDAHVFMGLDNFYVLDGANPPQPVENCPLREYLFEGDLNRNLQFAVQGRWDRNQQVVYWHYPSVDVETSDPQVCDKWVAWHRKTNRWTMGTLNVEAIVYPELPGSLPLTYGEFGSVYSTWGAADEVTYDSYIFSGSTDIVASVIMDDHILYTLTGEPQSDVASITLADFGNHEDFLFVRRLRPKFSIYPSLSGTSITDYKRLALGSTQTTGTTAYLDQEPGWLNLRDNARLHRFKLLFGAGDSEIIGLDVDYDIAGHR